VCPVTLEIFKMSKTEEARRLGVIQPAVNQGVRRGVGIIEERPLILKD
jgi:hypothetical protein